MVCIYADPHVDSMFAESVFSALQSEVMMKQDQTCADIRIVNDLPSVSFDGLTIVHTSEKDYPLLLESQYGTTIVVDRDTHDVVARNISYLSVMVTGECNTTCSYCQLDPTREWVCDDSSLSILHKFTDVYDISYIRYTGGEPTLEMEFIDRCNKLFPSTRKGMATNGIKLSEQYQRVPIGVMGMNDLSVHLVKYLYEDSVMNMYGEQQSYDDFALTYKRKFGTSSFYTLSVLLNRDNVEYASCFIECMKKHHISSVATFIETDRYGNFCMHPNMMCTRLGLSSWKTTLFIRSILRNKIGSLYFRAPKLDFTDSCYEILGREEKETCWLERLHQLPFDISATSFLRKKGYYDHIVNSAL